MILWLKKISKRWKMELMLPFLDNAVNRMAAVLGCIADIQYICWTETDKRLHSINPHEKYHFSHGLSHQVFNYSALILMLVKSHALQVTQKGRHLLLFSTRYRAIMRFQLFASWPPCEILKVIQIYKHSRNTIMYKALFLLPWGEQDMNYFLYRTGIRRNLSCKIECDSCMWIMTSIFSSVAIEHMSKTTPLFQAHC